MMRSFRAQAGHDVVCTLAEYWGRGEYPAIDELARLIEWRLSLKQLRNQPRRLLDANHF
jgi:hypothetical protein